ncbi:MFS transporter [Actinomyces minihominis]|uniref:MFS transporter n=1 Tax=Actinomyces minihominis TaxID=2002838 RepID=UPI000C0857F3|nr:MFS transporter [Actinomyces minihominis]
MSTLERLQPRFMTAVVILGLTGQLAWTVENMYLNVFVYQTITDSPHVIATMVAASALVAAITTLFIGAFSDRTGTRRPFIAIGYVLWGILTASFGFVQGGEGVAKAMTGAVVAIVILDCVMSFFGAAANDAAFSAWVTDKTDPGNRGRVDAVLQIMPLVAMLIVFGALDGLTQDGNWKLFFGLVGAVTVAVGVLSWFLTPDAPTIKKSEEPYFASVVYGLRPSTVRRNPRLYVLLLAWAIIGTSTQVFLPYIIIYMQFRLRLETYPIILAVVIIVASTLSILGGRLIDRFGKIASILPATTVMITGYLVMFWARTMGPVIVGGILVFSGMMLATAAIAASVRDATPPRHVGMVQGLRMIAMVLIPMWIGPFVGASVISGANETYVDLGVTKQVPTPWIFAAAAVIAVLVVIPVWWLGRLGVDHPSEVSAPVQ